MFNKIGQMADMMRQAGQMREAMRQASESLERLKVTGEAGGGKVRVTLTGKMEVDDVKIDPSLPGSVPINELEGMVFYAVNDALTRVRQEAAARMAQITGGIDIPGMDQLMGGGAS
jgi:DNA-binding YbaB/EbfC family protein